MSGWLIICAVVAGVGGRVLRWAITRKWQTLSVNPTRLVLPRMCPVCLSRNAGTIVEEDSPARQTANYVIAQRVEWRRVKVPYCARCRDRLDWSYLYGAIAGALCVIPAAVLFFPPNHDPELAFFILCLFFGYPAFVVITTLRKGIFFGKPYPTHMLARVRHGEYRDAMLTGSAVPRSDTPLPDDKGVWVHR